MLLSEAADSTRTRRDSRTSASRAFCYFQLESQRQMWEKRRSLSENRHLKDQTTINKFMMARATNESILEAITALTNTVNQIQQLVTKSSTDAIQSQGAKKGKVLEYLATEKGKPRDQREATYLGKMIYKIPDPEDAKSTWITEVRSTTEEKIKTLATAMKYGWEACQSIQDDRDKLLGIPESPNK